MRARAWLFLTSIVAMAVASSVIFPAHTPLIVSVAIIAALAYLLTELNASTRRLVQEEESEFDRVLKVSEHEPSVPEDLRRAMRAFGWGSYEPGYFDFRVRPILRELIHHKVQEAHQIDLTAEPQRAHGVVHPELLGLFGDARAERIYGRNINTGDLERMISLIESV